MERLIDVLATIPSKLNTFSMWYFALAMVSYNISRILAFLFNRLLSVFIDID
ncbi:MAG TPA: hypothetical protein VFF29_02810 [Bacteroidota bacterium]|nr:hypothetical protein [Bacteroidota bacterium]